MLMVVRETDGRLWLCCEPCVQSLDLRPKAVLGEYQGKVYVDSILHEGFLVREPETVCQRCSET